MLNVSEIPREPKGNGRKGIVQFFAMLVLLQYPVGEAPVSDYGMHVAELLSSPPALAVAFL